MTAKEYRPNSYWEDLISRQPDLRSVGYPQLSLAFNECLYRAMANTVDRALRGIGMGGDGVTDLHVLDIGSGTGFWIDFWLARGARHITGIDLSSSSVTRLSETYPRLNFDCRNVADPLPPDYSGAFDVVSAMHVLHHIPSQEDWTRALANLARTLKPSGFLLIMDPVIRYRWWGRPFDSASNGRPRTLAEHVSVLEQEEVAIQRVMPTVTILSNPVDTKWETEFRLLERWWSRFCGVASRESLMRRTQHLVYGVDRLLCRLNYMPSSKLLVCRREEA